MMNIVIISEFCEDFSNTDNDRFLYLAKLLSKKLDGNDIEIITSSFRHTTKKHRRKPIDMWPFTITFLEEPGYPQNICLKRFHSHWVWGKNVIRYLKKRSNKPDVVYCAVPSLTAPGLVARYCEKEHIRFIIDVQDLWPEAFKMVVNIPIVSHIAFAPFQFLANEIYKRADAICGVSDTYCKRASRVNKKVGKTTTVFLGTELDTFDKYAAESPILERSFSEIWLAYCGTLGRSYDLIGTIDALAILNNPNLHFIIMGDGPQKKEFEKYALEKSIKATFTGRLPYNQMCSLLSNCDIVVNPIVHMAAQSIINKHADYAASGLPVLNTQESDEYKTLVENYQMGFNCKNNDAMDLAEKLEILANNERLRRQMGRNARKCAKEKFDRKETYLTLVRIIMDE